MAAIAMRFTCLLLMLLLFITAWLSNAYAPQAVEVDAVSNGNAFMKNEIIGGRKMAPPNVNDMRRVAIKGNEAFAGNSKTTMSTANRMVGKCGYKGKEVLNMGKGKKRSGSGDRFCGGVKESGFVAFNADYHEPMHHPPKNN